MSIRSLLPRHRHRDQVPVMHLRSQIDQLFDDFPALDWGNVGLPLSNDAFITPKTDVVETDKSYQLHIEMPGITKEQLTVNLSGDVLTIQGEKKAEKSTSEKNYHSIERSYGSYQRSFTLPTNIDSHQITAEFSNGVLIVDIPKSHETVTKSRTIDIQEN